MAWRQVVISKVKCPSYKGLLKLVRQTKFHLNSDQFDAVKAGDYFCDRCPEDIGTAGKAQTGHRDVEPLKEKPKTTDEIVMDVLSWIAERSYRYMPADGLIIAFEEADRIVHNEGVQSLLDKDPKDSHWF